MVARSVRQRVAETRGFNRFYTKQIGVLQEAFLRSPFSLTEARVVYELAQHDETTATELRSELGIDAGYLSRILKQFQARGLLRTRRSRTDGRQVRLALSEQGRDAFTMLNERSDEEIGAMLGRLSAAEQTRLLRAMRTITGLLDAPRGRKPALLLRRPRPGDMGWVVHRHGALYWEEYGWDARFEALVASIVAEFVQRFDPKRERCWIAELGGEIVGCVFLVKKTATVAKLRLLLVEPRARGFGIGNRLVNECIRFARRAGYRKVTLWTNDVLVAARHIYERAGFRLVDEERHRSYGKDLVGQTRELTL
ncbi:MAG TPA: bifunctional helix-turn-helix transcriptional regulator/GNAT family N-acetyltransferase [Thermoplasmata archaeon]